jgi:hypothetical protein
MFSVQTHLRRGRELTNVVSGPRDFGQNESDCKYSIYTGDEAMPPGYEFEIKRRGRRWEYRVHDHEGFMVAIGSERTRLTARYRAERSLFAALVWSSRFYGSSSDDMTLR